MPDYDSRAANPYPYVTREEAAAAPGDRIAKAARNIATREFQGIPQRAFLLGDNDHSPVMKSLRSFVGPVYELLALIDVGEDGGGPLDTAARRVQDMLDNPVTSEPTDES